MSSLRTRCLEIENKYLRNNIKFEYDVNSFQFLRFRRNDLLTHHLRLKVNNIFNFMQNIFHNIIHIFVLIIYFKNIFQRPQKTNRWGRRAAGLQARKHRQSSSFEMSEHNLSLNVFIESVSRLMEFMISINILKWIFHGLNICQKYKKMKLLSTALTQLSSIIPVNVVTRYSQLKNNANFELKHIFRWHLSLNVSQKHWWYVMEEENVTLHFYYYYYNNNYYYYLVMH